MHDRYSARRLDEFYSVFVQGLAIALLSLVAGCQDDSSPPPPPPHSAPIFTPSPTLSVLENTTRVTHVKANDAEGDTVTYSIAGGLDAEWFEINVQTGELRFIQPLDFDAPVDSNQNNVYMVVVAASDGVTTTSQILEVTVTGVGLTVEVKSAYIKTLSFRWNAIEGATYYKLYADPNGNSEFTQVGTDLTATQTHVAIPVHLTDWINSHYVVEGYNDQGQVFRSKPKAIDALMLDSIGYVKASNTDEFDRFGASIALSADGLTLAVGAPGEASDATSIGADQDNNRADGAGAVYVYVRAGSVWTQQAYIKASNTDARDQFGSSVALSADGQTLAVGAIGEDSDVTDVDVDQFDNSALDAGAVYVYARAETVWAQQAYLKASNADAKDRFGTSVALSADGQILAIGASGESSGVPEGDDIQRDNSATNAGAVYVFTLVESAWLQQSYLKASNAEAHDRFGTSVVLSANGQIVIVGAPGEDSAKSGVAAEEDNSAKEAGAVYMFTRVGAVWEQQAYLKASNAGAGDEFGISLALSAEGETLAVGAAYDTHAATGIDGDKDDNSVDQAGAVYVYTRAEAVWTQQAYLKASITDTEDYFGISVALSADGQIVAIGAWGESSTAKGVNGDPDDNTAFYAGAAYMFTRTGAEWSQHAYLKASNTDAFDYFGSSVAMSADGLTLVVGSPGEASGATGIDGDRYDNGVSDAGAIYLY